MIVIGLLIYATGVIAVGVRLAHHMAFRLDRFDWQFSKYDIWGPFILNVIFWPLLLLRPSLLLDPSTFFKNDYGIVDRIREESRLSINPPPCGKRILFRQSTSRYEQVFGEIIFHSHDVIDTVRQRLDENPNLKKDQEASILRWVESADDSITKPTAVPSAWWRFEYIADRIIRTGTATVHCLKCELYIDTEKLILKKHHQPIGWSFDRIECPNGHLLLIMETMHFMMRPKVGKDH